MRLNGPDRLYPDTKYLSLDREKGLAILALWGNVAARDKVVMNIIPFVMRMARRFARGGVPFVDLVQHALCKCFEKFHKYDPSLGFTPKTYLGTVARRQMQLMTARDGVVVLPADMSDLTAGVAKAAEDAKDVLSLDAEFKTATTKAKLSLYDVLVDINADLPGDSCELLRMLFEKLNPRYRKVMEMRFIDGMSYKQVGAALGVTKTRIEQIVKASVRKLRRIVKSRGERLVA